MSLNAKSMSALLSCALCLLSGCVNLGAGTTQRTRLFVLSPLTTAETTATQRTDGDFSLGVGPLTLPAYLDRPQVVTRIADNEIGIAAFANWAEPLDRNFQRTLAENLALLLGTQGVYPHPWRSALRPTHRLLLEVIRFDANPAGDAVLSVRWEVLDNRGEPMIPKRKGVFRQTVTQGDVAGVVAAMSSVLADFSREAAAAIASQP
jgi:uncharacterized lipoprotein YmbA